MKLFTIIAAAFSLGLGAAAVLADGGQTGAKTGDHHRTITGTVVADKSGVLTVKTSDGTTMPVTPKASERHGHAVPKVGEEVTLVLNENNNVIDVHPKRDRCASQRSGRHPYVRHRQAGIRGQDEA